ncbi:diaminopimelate epimerase [Bombilactobacillus bombi]|uniref:diaminopimelate epimerase n=1 Tax=Bombilactobacillus bombi TaxID=1303590 RepID=UPI000E58500C|nr:diaminopimelate epimerase [Bombilactobacillus bombi]AXX64720.1 diaminopimelate epimerase [Bombilactobacillus bombi]
MVTIQKVHGSQNQFFLLDQTTLQQPLTQEELVILAKNITNSQTGLLGGADGLLVVSNSQHLPALGKMQVINADGTIASMCGNGLRTVGRYLAEKYQQNDFIVETEQADLKVTCQADWAPDVKAISVEISPVSFQRAALPFDNLGTEQLINQPVPVLASDLKFTAIAVPNPHLISFVSAKILAGDLLKNLGTKLNQANPYFPDGVNVSFAQIINEQQLFVQTFERGVGFTNACGTGMSATSLAFALIHPELNIFDRLLTVYNPGGYVQTRVHQTDNHYWIELIGNATITHYLDLNENDLHHATIDPAQVKITPTVEDAAYQQFIKDRRP